jgi:hypothetical protein
MYSYLSGENRPDQNEQENEQERLYSTIKIFQVFPCIHLSLETRSILVISCVYVVTRSILFILIHVLFQQLIVSIISSDTQDSDISVKDTHTLISVISLLAHHLDPDGQQVS